MRVSADFFRLGADQSKNLWGRFDKAIDDEKSKGARG